MRSKFVDGLKFRIEADHNVRRAMAKRMRDRGVQVIENEHGIKVHKSTNTEETYDNRSQASYNRYSNQKKMNIRILMNTIIKSKESTISWCKEKNLIKSGMKCDHCNMDMKWVKDKGKTFFSSIFISIF